jgi:hypothetical protein
MRRIGYCAGFDVRTSIEPSLSTSVKSENRTPVLVHKFAQFFPRIVRANF